MNRRFVTHEVNKPSAELKKKDERKHEIQKLKKAVEGVTEDDWESKLSFYKQLLESDPDNAQYKRKAIEYLEKMVGRIPQSRYADNLMLYEQLLKLGPDNPKYKRKVSYYKTKLGGEDHRRKEKTDTLTVNMVTDSLDHLNSVLRGKTPEEARQIAGPPDRIQHETAWGYKCTYWIYGTTYTDKDRGIVFVKGKALTVTFY